MRGILPTIANIARHTRSEYWNPSGESEFRKFAETGTPPGQAEALARHFDDLRAEPIEPEIGPNEAGRRAQRGPKRSF